MNLKRPTLTGAAEKIMTSIGPEIVQCRTCYLREADCLVQSETNPLVECSICLSYRKRHQTSRPACRAIRDRMRAAESPSKPRRCRQCQVKDQARWMYVRRDKVDMRLCEPCGAALAARERENACEECGDKLLLLDVTTHVQTVCRACREYFERHKRKRSEVLKLRRWMQKTGREANPDLYARCQKCSSVKTRSWHFIPDDRCGDGIIVNGIRVCDDCVADRDVKTVDNLFLLSCTCCSTMFATDDEGKIECKVCSAYRRRTGQVRPSRLIVQAQSRRLAKVSNPDTRPSCAACRCIYPGDKPTSTWRYKQGRRLCRRCFKLKIEK